MKWCGAFAIAFMYGTRIKCTPFASAIPPSFQQPEQSWSKKYEALAEEDGSLPPMQLMQLLYRIVLPGGRYASVVAAGRKAVPQKQEVGASFLVVWAL